MKSEGGGSVRAPVVRALLHELDELDERDQRAIAGGMYARQFAEVERALAAMTTSCLPDVAAIMQGPDSEWIKMRALDIAARFDDPRAEGILRDAADSESESIRVTARRLLEARGLVRRP